MPGRARGLPSTLNLVLDDGCEIEALVRLNRRARRIIVKVETSGEVVVVLPAKRRLAEARAFLRRHQAWIRCRLDALPPQVAFADGTEIPLFDVPHRIRHCPSARAGVRLESSEILVSGRSEHLPRRLEDWLRGQARAEIAPRLRRDVAALGKPLGRLIIRDPKTRWASCAQSGDFSFSWRLVMAPEAVLDYVVAHEAAHLIEANHSPAFWRLVARLHPEPAAARRWLARNGPRLHRIG